MIVEGGVGGAEGCSSHPCADTSLLLARRLSSQMPLGVIPVESGAVPPLLRDRATRDQGPGHRIVLAGSSLHGGPQWNRTVHHRTYPQPLLHCVPRYVPVWHLTDCEDGVANGAGP